MVFHGRVHWRFDGDLVGYAQATMLNSKVKGDLPRNTRKKGREKTNVWAYFLNFFRVVRVFRGEKGFMILPFFDSVMMRMA